MSNPFANTDQVNAVIKVRRGPEADRENTVFEDGELIYSTDKKRLFVGDGFNGNGTEGGTLVGNKVWYVDSFDKLPEIQISDLVYRTDLKAFYLLHSSNYLLSSNYALVGGLKLITDNVNITPYTLPNATKLIKGGIIVGDGLSASNTGLLTIDFDPNAFKLDATNKLTLKDATTITLTDASYTGKGVVQISDGVSYSKGGLDVTNGIIGVNIDNTTIKLNGSNTLYVDPLSVITPASTTQIGCIKVGKALSANPDSTLDVRVDNTTIKIDGANQLYVDTANVGGSGGSGGSGSINIEDDGTNVPSVDTLNFTTGFDVNKSASKAIINLSIATKTDLGGVIAGDGISVNAGGTITPDVDKTSIDFDGTGKLSVKQSYVYDEIDNSWIGSATLATNGTQVFNSGVLIQWGQGTITSSTNTTVNFLSAFSAAPYSVTATNLTTGAVVAIGTGNFTANNFRAYLNASGTATFSWVAVGPY